MTSKEASKRAFSLVEVTLALGLASFCLVTIFGLLPVGVTSNRAAVEQTAANGLISTVAADLRATPKASSAQAAPISALFGVQFPAQNATGDSVSTIYFNAEGIPSSTLGADSRYRLRVRFIAPSQASTSATLATLACSWPAAADPALGNISGCAETFVALNRN